MERVLSHRFWVQGFEISGGLPRGSIVVPFWELPCRILNMNPKKENTLEPLGTAVERLGPGFMRDVGLAKAYDFGRRVQSWGYEI